MSLGIENTAEEVEKLIQVLKEIDRKPQHLVNKNTALEREKTSNLSKTSVKKQMEEFVKAAAMKVYPQKHQQ